MLIYFKLSSVKIRCIRDKSQRNIPPNSLYFIFFWGQYAYVQNSSIYTNEPAKAWRGHINSHSDAWSVPCFEQHTFPAPLFCYLITLLHWNYNIDASSSKKTRTDHRGAQKRKAGLTGASHLFQKKKKSLFIHFKAFLSTLKMSVIFAQWRLAL